MFTGVCMLFQADNNSRSSYRVCAPVYFKLYFNLWNN